MIKIDDEWLKMQKHAIITLGMYEGNDTWVLMLKANWLNKNGLIYTHSDAYINYMTTNKTYYGTSKSN